MTKTSDTAARTSIEASALQLKLPTIRTNLDQIVEEAARHQTSHLDFLAEILATEVDTRNERRRARRTKEARFPRLKRLADFDTKHSPVNPATIATLAKGDYIKNGHPVVLLGDSGTGKSHLLIGLGHAACEQGHRVRYTTTAQLANELAEAQSDRQLSRLVARYGRYDLLCLDELGYVALDTQGAELIFQILTEREEKSSIAIATNLPFSEWHKVITDPRLAAAIVDRVTYNATIIETGTDSYRLKTSRGQNT